VHAPYLSTLVLAAAGGTGSDEWSRLDRDIDALATRVAPEGEATAFALDLLLRSYYGSSGDDVFAAGGPGGPDYGGFRIADAMLGAQGRVGDFDLVFLADAADSTAFPPKGAGSGTHDLDIRDAWVRTGCPNSKLYFGNFRCPLVGSSMVQEDALLFPDRTRLGQMFDVYQPGIAGTYDTGPFHLKLAVQNGADGAAEEYGMVLRGDWYSGTERRGYDEGGYWRLGNDAFAARIGAAYFNDDSTVGGNDVGSAVTVDGHLTFSRFSFGFEVVDMDEDLAGMMLGNVNEDATPYSATLGYSINDRWEAAVRYEDLDDQAERTLAGGGVNYYVEGHAAKWHLGLSQFEDMVDDGVLVQFGLSVGSSPAR
jgi:hypothetical protein